jgi:hypothetical protein
MAVFVRPKTQTIETGERRRRAPAIFPFADEESDA